MWQPEALRRHINHDLDTRDLVESDKATGQATRRSHLGDAPDGPRGVVMHSHEAFVSYPEQERLIFLDSSRSESRSGGRKCHMRPRPVAVHRSLT